MAKETFSIPGVITKKIKELGYQVDTSMTSYINEWWNWYTFQDDWHDSWYTAIDGSESKRRRMSLHPARRACQEWSRLILNEATKISVESESTEGEPDGDTAKSESANDWLAQYLAESRYWANTQALTDKAFGLGTGAQALWFDMVDSEVTAIKIRNYDARMTIPLSWDVEGVTECAFCTRITIKGKKAFQLQVHRLEDTQYVIYTYVFQNGKELDPEENGILDRFETYCPYPTFGIIKPGIENTKVDLSPFGVSVFDDAIDAMKAVDLAYDSIFQEIELTEAIVFMSDDMIDVKKGPDGKPRALPKSKDRKLFRMVAGNGVESMYNVYSPDIRIEPIRQAFDVALAEFGDLTGFGQDYFTLDKKTGLKTATEVSADNSALMRNIRRHENSISMGIEAIMTALLHCARVHLHVNIEESFGKIEVLYDDSIITDTVSEKNMMLAEIAAGVRPKWHYLVKFEGKTEEEARAELPSEDSIDIGF